MVLPLGLFSVLSFWYLPKLGLRLVVFAGMVLISAGFVCLHGMQINSSYPDVVWRILVFSCGIGLCTAPTTSAIMGAVPDEKQGVASAINDATREIGGALGIAVAGSILAERYSHLLSPRLAVFPPQVRHPVSASLAQAIEIANKLGPQGNQIIQMGKEAFVAATHTSTSCWRSSSPRPRYRSGCGHPDETVSNCAWCAGSDRPSSAGADELGRAVPDHHNRRVRAAAGDRGQDRSVHDP